MEGMTSKHSQPCQQVPELLLEINNVKTQTLAPIPQVKPLCGSSWVPWSSVKAKVSSSGAQSCRCSKREVFGWGKLLINCVINAKYLLSVME